MNNHLDCQLKIAQLQAEKEQLRLLLSIILNTAYYAVNGPEPHEENEEKEVQDE